MSDPVPAPLPCPFCGHVGLVFSEGSTFRWLQYSCGGCGMGSETRVQTLGAGTKDEWRAEAERRAVQEWNTRAALAAQPADAAVDEATAYAYRLACYIHANHYQDVPQWKPWPDLLGLLTQINNMVCGLERKQPAPMLTDEQMRSLIERECGPVQRMGDMLWAVEVGRAVELAIRGQT